MNMIEVDGLTRRFGDFTAVDHISFTVEKGIIFGFLGCRWSAIRSVGNCSGKMSVDERTDIDDERADQITYHERGAGTTVGGRRSGAASWGE